MRDFGQETSPAAGTESTKALDNLSGVHAAFCVLGNGRWAQPPDMGRAKSFMELCKSAAVPHVTLLSSCWAHTSSRAESARKHAEIADLFASAGFQRLSIFRPSLISRDGVAIPAEDAGMAEKVYSTAFPIARQFMSSSYREVSLDDIVLAMRLNTELCDSPDKVEKLDFIDMMKIIGKEDTI